MNGRIIIVCEGETEQGFCNESLRKFFSKQNIYIDCPLIKTSNGGIVKWGSLKKQLLSHLKNDTSAFVTTLIDYYGIKQKHNFPKWKEAEKEQDKNKRMDILEKGMALDIGEEYEYRYIHIYNCTNLKLYYLII